MQLIYRGNARFQVFKLSLLYIHNIRNFTGTFKLEMKCKIICLILLVPAEFFYVKMQLRSTHKVKGVEGQRGEEIMLPMATNQNNSRYNKYVRNIDLHCFC